MSDNDIKTCKRCHMKYRMIIIGDCWPGGKEQEEVICPWCGIVDGMMTTSGSVHTEKVEETDIV